VLTRFLAVFLISLGSFIGSSIAEEFVCPLNFVRTVVNFLGGGILGSVGCKTG
jgi:hypothetical protein